MVASDFALAFQPHGFDQQRVRYPAFNPAVWFWGSRGVLPAGMCLRERSLGRILDRLKQRKHLKAWTISFAAPRINTISLTTVFCADTSVCVRCRRLGMGLEALPEWAGPAAFCFALGSLVLFFSEEFVASFNRYSSSPVALGLCRCAVEIDSRYILASATH